jgi:hypothetical protein
MKYNDIKVIPLDMVKWNENINTTVREHLIKKGREVPATSIFSVSGRYAVIQGTNFIIDSECCGEVGGFLKANIYEEGVTDGKKWVDCFPAITGNYDINSLKEEFGMSEISLPEFMGDRFNYNKRLKSNQEVCLKEVKKQLSAKI